MSEDDKIKLPERLYYPLPEAAKKIGSGCEVKDVIHYGAIGALNISVYLTEITPETGDAIFFLDATRFTEDKSLPSHFFGDNFLIGDVHLNDRPLGWCASVLKGFFFIKSVSLIGAEFDIEGGKIKIDFISTSTKDGDGVEIYFMNKKGFIEVPFNRLCVMANEISNIRSSGSMPVFSDDKKETDKTIAKKENLIKALLTLVPEFSDVDIESLAVSKIKHIAEVAASARGIDFPKTDLGTWSKYLERGRHKK